MRGGTARFVDIGCGTVYKIATDDTGSTLYAFTGGSDGASKGTLVLMQWKICMERIGGGAVVQRQRGVVFKTVSGGSERVRTHFGAGRFKPVAD